MMFSLGNASGEFDGWTPPGATPEWKPDPPSPEWLRRQEILKSCKTVPKGAPPKGMRIEALKADMSTDPETFYSQEKW